MNVDLGETCHKPHQKCEVVFMCMVAILPLLCLIDGSNNVLRLLQSIQLHTTIQQKRGHKIKCPVLDRERVSQKKRAQEGGGDCACVDWGVRLHKKQDLAYKCLLLSLDQNTEMVHYIARFYHHHLCLFYPIDSKCYGWMDDLIDGWMDGWMKQRLTQS